MKITLQELRRMGIFEEIDTPQVVYHMTNRENLDSILRDGKIRSVRGPGEKADFVTYFFPAVEEIPVYIELTGANTGRQYYDFDGRLRIAPPLVHEETIVLKLRPQGRQDMEWYKEKPAKGVNNSSLSNDSVEKLQEYMSAARVCHYGPMRFQKDPEIIELIEIDKLPASDKLKDILRIKGKQEAEK